MAAAVQEVSAALVKELGKQSKGSERTLAVREEQRESEKIFLTQV